MVAGLLNPVSGTLEIDNEDAAQFSPSQREIGWVPQSYALFNHLTVAENVAFGLRARRVPRAEQQPRVAEALALCHIEQFAKRFPAELSGGQRQRVAIARALVTRPKVLLLDEPLAALDPQLRKAIRVALAALLRDSGVTSILVTHDQTEALAMADHVAVMRDGIVEQMAPPEMLWSRPANAFVAEFVGSATVVPARRQGGDYRVIDGLNLKVPGAVSDRVRVALRPRDLALGGEGARFRVLSHEFTGDTWQIVGELDNGQILTVTSDETHQMGSYTNVQARPGASIAEVEA